MEKTIIDVYTGWEYELKGDYYYPTGRVQRNGEMTPSELPEDNRPEEEKPVGVWGADRRWRSLPRGKSTDRRGSGDQRHLQYIKQYKKNLYYDLYVSRRLNGYLAEIEALAEEMFFRLVKAMAAREGVTEALKSADQMRWVGLMNNMQNRAREIVNRELISV